MIGALRLDLRGRTRYAWSAAFVCLAASSGCDRDRIPDPAEAPSGGDTIAAVRTSGLQPGPAVHVDSMTNPYAGDPDSVAEGRRLFSWMNCHG